MRTPGSPSPVTVYWRPGCPYCARLRRELRGIGLATAEVNIWEDPAAAATVRAFASGNETVPTVVVGGMGLVNPSASAVLEAVRVAAPELVADDGVYVRARRRRALYAAQWAAVGAVVVASFTAEAVGHAGVSWALDGVALAVYLGFRIARWRSVTGGRAASTRRGGT